MTRRMPRKRYTPVSNSPTNAEGKIALRQWATEQIAGRRLHIADLFAGEGDIWGAVRQRTKKELVVFANDIAYGKGYSVGKAEAIAGAVRDFDIVDLDAYSDPCPCLVKLTGKEHGVIIITLVTSARNGRVPIATALGMPNDYSTAFRKAPPEVKTTFILKGLLALTGASRMRYFTQDAPGVLRLYAALLIGDGRQQRPPAPPIPESADWKVYLAETPDGKYVGCTRLDIPARLRGHLHKPTTLLAQSIQKHGIDSVRWRILRRYRDAKEAYAAEVDAIARHNTLAPCGLNKTPGGEQHTPFSRRATK